MVSLRLTRVGKKKLPIFRLIAIDKHRDPWGKAIEYLGTINPHTKVRDLKNDRIAHWLSVGAQPSKTVHNILVDEKLIDAKKESVSVLTKKRKGKMNEAIEAKAQAEAEAKLKAEEAAAAAKEAEAAAKAEAEAAKEAEAEAAKAAEEAPAAAEEAADAPAEAEAPAAEETPAEAEAPAAE